MKKTDNSKGIEPRYMTSTKRNYYLASVDENVQQLVKEEIDGLTKVLIELKSQYDELKRENVSKKSETEELCKKIDSLQKMDCNCNKKIEDAEELSKNLAEAIKNKRIILNEASYNLKTLQNTIRKLKKDTFLIRSKIIESDEINKKNKNKLGKAKIVETQLKECHNKIYTKINEQRNRNLFNENEYSLQLQYYNTIISQKNMFIKSADERKQRQQKIAEEAKNDSADKQEVERRKKLMLLKLYNILLRKNLEKEQRKNEELEDIYAQITNICGTSNLIKLTKKMKFKNNRYNNMISKINIIQNEIKVLDDDIKDKENELTELKTIVLCKEIDDKNIKAINVNIIEEKESKLLEE